jgi:outer membrane protein assembly factor BamC
MNSMATPANQVCRGGWRRAGLRLAVLGLGAVLAGCSSLNDILPDQKVDYRRQKVAENDLEIPPDLSSSGIGDAMAVPGVTATLSEYEQQRLAGGRGPVLAGSGAVLPAVDSARILRDGGQRWLEIDAAPDVVWPRLVSFWRQNGVLLVEQDPAVGVMKTDWLENRADIKQGFVTELFRGALDSLYSAATRDQFRVRLEPGERSGSTALFLTHRGMEEQYSRDSAGNTQNTFWVTRPNDPELEAEMLRRIMLHLGVAERQAGRALAQAGGSGVPRADLVADRSGGSALLVAADYAATWRLVGMALERVGFLVEDRDRSAGFYYVRYDDPTRKEDEGFLSKLAFWRDRPRFDRDVLYRIQLEDRGESTRVAVRTAQGEPEPSATANRILTLIQEQIR